MRRVDDVWSAKREGHATWSGGHVGALGERLLGRALADLLDSTTDARVLRSIAEDEAGSRSSPALVRKTLDEVSVWR